MVPLEITPATVILGLVLVFLAVLAVRRLVKNGTCDCHKSESGSCTGCAVHGASAGSSTSCAGCAAADRMVADIDRTLH